MNTQRLLADLDLAPLLDQIAAFGAPLWNADPCWIPPTAPYAPDNIVLRYDHRDRHWSSWNKPAFSILSAARPIVAALKAAADCDVLGKVGITRMQPGDVLAPHIDAQRKPVLFERYQVPLVVASGVRFIVAGETVPMQPGEVWWFDKTVTHSVENFSSQLRLAMVVEMHRWD